MYIFAYNDHMCMSLSLSLYYPDSIALRVEPDRCSGPTGPSRRLPCRATLPTT